jgi:hypothetical protein
LSAVTKAGFAPAFFVRLAGAQTTHLLPVSVKRNFFTLFGRSAVVLVTFANG